VPYQAGDQVTDELMAALAASWAQAGIHVRVEPVALNSLVAQIQRCSGPHCTWEIGGAGGWIYGLYPSGELIFGTSSPINTGSYSDRTADRLIQRSITTDAGLTAYENYIAKQLPVLWLPWTPTILEVKKHLGGVDLNPFGAYTPESWRVR
jgi:peptide/nickel transport system substrate-binding protein